MLPKIPAQPMFVVRERCISCGSTQSAELSSGKFGDDPLRTFVDGDPWGENPLPLLENERWALHECKSCTQRQHRYILSPDWNNVRFSRWMSEASIRQFEDDHGSNHDPCRDVQHVLRLRDMGVQRVLDFGCGFGQFLEMCHLFGLDAHGVDRSNARRAGAGVQILSALEDVTGTFDAITMFEVLEHLDDPLATLKALRSRLNAHGFMIVEVPDTTGISSFTDRESYYKIHPLDHINAFTPESLVAIMRKAGFEPIKKEAAFVTTSLKRVAKDLARANIKQRSTQRYFRA